MTTYAISTTLEAGYPESVERTRAALAEQGFGILTEIDVAATMKAKLSQDMPAYLIFGACNPQLAFTALGIDPSIGLLLPCNVVVRSLETDRTLVEALDPTVMVTATGNPEFTDVAAQAATLLASVLSELGTPACHSTPTQPSR